MVRYLLKAARQSPLLIFLVALVVLAACSEEPERISVEVTSQESTTSTMPSDPEFASILPGEAFQMIRESDILVVDVRTEAEREQVRIAGSLAVPMGDIMRGDAELPRDRPLLLVCSVGGRSYAAGLYLMKEEYLKVFNLRGGLSAWEKAGLPLEHGKQ